MNLEVNGTVIEFSPIEGYRKWDASDELLLDEGIKGKTLVINDNYGALSCGIKGEVYSYSHSFLKRQEINDTLTLNNKNITIVTELENLPETIDNVVLKLPKSIDLLEYYLGLLSKKYSGTNFIACGMVKYMPISMVRLTESYFKDVRTSLAKKKARLIYGTIADNCENKEVFPIEYELDGKLKSKGKSRIPEDFKILSYPGVFSYKSLDLGTRFIIPQIPSGSNGVIIDLGCGSGIIGLIAKSRNPEADVYLADESYLAIESARLTFEKNNMEGNFVIGDKLGAFKKDFANLIICNPPFHQDSKVLTDTAVKMFKEAKKVLKPGGRFLVVANKHLGYHKHIRQVFHNMKIINKNEKFNIYSSYKQL